MAPPRPRVFVAVETSLGRRVVVKVVSQDLALGISTERFRHEIQLAAGEADGMLYHTI